MLTTFFAFELLSPKTLHWKKEVPHCEESLLFLSFQVVVFRVTTFFDDRKVLGILAR
jgi:hypothetical protein